MTRPKHPLLLVVLDGWGVGDGGPHDAVAAAGANTLDALRRDGAWTELEASGQAVGLPDGQMGNSEVGHLNLGAGRVVPQEIVRISRGIRDGSFYQNPVLVEACRQVKGRRLHVLGLLGPGGVHSHQDHLVALCELARRQGVADVAVHHILDGRDTPPKSALEFAVGIQDQLTSRGARVATVAGRYFTMDRDQRWERTRRGWLALVDGQGHHAAKTAAAIQAAYSRGETDEFVEPTVVGEPAPIRDGDVVVCYNFRPDRMRQIVRMLADPDFDEVALERRPRATVVTMTQYDKTFGSMGVRVAFEPTHPGQTLGEVYAKAGLRQLRVAETEKYAHVTYFFNGGVEAPFKGEERRLVPSSKVATYDLKPEMSAPQIADTVLQGLREGFDLIVVNFANADMVGHTGKMDATVAACKAVEAALARVAPAALKAGYVVAVTADHGNAERMQDEEGRPQTAHTTSRVPFYVATPAGTRLRLASGGALRDVAPTLLNIVGLPKPDVMDGRSLVR